MLLRYLLHVYQNFQHNAMSGVSIHTRKQVFHFPFSGPFWQRRFSQLSAITLGQRCRLRPESPTLTVMVAHSVGIERRASEVVRQATHTERRTRKTQGSQCILTATLMTVAETTPFEHPITAHPAAVVTAHMHGSLRSTLVAHNA